MLERSSAVEREGLRRWPAAVDDGRRPCEGVKLEGLDGSGAGVSDSSIVSPPGASVGFSGVASAAGVCSPAEVSDGVGFSSVAAGVAVGELSAAAEVSFSVEALAFLLFCFFICSNCHRSEQELGNCGGWRC